MIRKILIIILGPINVMPLLILYVKIFGSYSGAEIGHLQSIPLILQGSTDLGGSNMYASGLALYVTLGILASFYLYLCLKDKDYLKDKSLIGRGIFCLSFHILLFLLLGLVMRHPDDKNMYLLFALIYIAQFFAIIWIVKKKKDRFVFLAPILIYLFLLIAWDGSSPKAGQVVNAGVPPKWEARGIRHSIMLKWHKIGDSFFSFLGFYNKYRNYRTEISASLEGGV